MKSRQMQCGYVGKEVENDQNNNNHNRRTIKNDQNAESMIRHGSDGMGEHNTQLPGSQGTRILDHH